MTKKDDTPVERQLFRYWVELRDLRDGTVRELPVTFVKRIPLTEKPKRGAPEPPPELRLRVQHAGRTFEALDTDDLARQLRGEYPDGIFERTLRCERDTAAEEKRRSALDQLARIIAEAAVRRMADEGEM